MIDQIQTLPVFKPSMLYVEQRFSILDTEGEAKYYGNIRGLFPVDANGDPDAARTPRFTGEIQIIVGTPQGPAPIPIQFDLPFATITEACDKFFEVGMVQVQAFESKMIQNNLLQGARRK